MGVTTNHRLLVFGKGSCYAVGVSEEGTLSHGLQRGSQLLLVMIDSQAGCLLIIDICSHISLSPFLFLATFQFLSFFPKTRSHYVAQASSKVVMAILFWTLEHGIWGLCPAHLPSFLLNSKRE